MIIAIDGPSGAGKSTVANRVARRLGAQLIDTGALYRTIAYEAQKRGLDVEDGSEVAEVVPGLDFHFEFIDGANVLFCNGKQMSDDRIRTPQISELTSQISAKPEVRDALLEVQRDLGRSQDSVMEGRDIGTVVFPEADVKIFLTASADVRAKRRYDELRDRGEDPDYDELVEQIKIRDERDQNRDVAPLKKAKDAVEIDSSSLSIEEVVEEIIRQVE
jgi:cytidylate kinase